MFKKYYALHSIEIIYMSNINGYITKVFTIIKIVLQLLFSMKQNQISTIPILKKISTAQTNTIFYPPSTFKF